MNDTVCTVVAKTVPVLFLGSINCGVAEKAVLNKAYITIGLLTVDRCTEKND